MTQNIAWSDASDELTVVTRTLDAPCPIETSGFRATLVDVRDGLRTGLARMDGLVVNAADEGDVFIRVSRPSDHAATCMLLDVVVGKGGTKLIEGGVDIELFATTRRTVALYNPYVISPDSNLRPGTRLLAALARTHLDVRTQVIADFNSDGDDEEDRDLYLEYFFPHLASVGLQIGRKERFALGFWGSTASERFNPYRVGILYDQ